MSNIVKTWTQWLSSSRFSYMNEEQKQQTFLWLFEVRDKVLKRAKIQPDDFILDIGTGNGLLSFGAFEILKNLNGNGRVIASDAFIDCVEECIKIAEQCGIREQMDFIQANAVDTKLPQNSLDIVVMRSVLVHILDKQKAINEFFRILNPHGGRISIFEPIIRKNTKYFELMTPEKYHNFEELKAAEEKMVCDMDDPLMNFDEDTLKNNFEQAGFKNIDIEIKVQSSTYKVFREMIDPWLNTPPSPGKPTVREKYLQHLPQEEVEKFIGILKEDLHERIITINSPTAYISAEK